jgi:enolase
MKIFDANIKIIQDSRGKDTLSAELRGTDADKRGIIAAEASVPSGKSTGIHEAFVLEPKKAIEKFGEIRNEILGKEFESQEEFDNFLIQLDGTSNKSNLGGNLILSLSLAFARLKAKSEGRELFQYIKQISNLKSQISNLPRPIFNVINGGAHSPLNFAERTRNYVEKIQHISASVQHSSAFLDFQEFQIIPEVNDFGMALGLGQEFYKKLKESLETKFGKENISLGDEAGFCAPFQNNEEAVEILAELLAKYNYPLKIGLDIAASQLYKDGYYLIGGKKYSAEELKDLYLKLVETYNIISIEDPFYEESFNAFGKLTIALHYIGDRRDNVIEKILVITDDLTTTNPSRLKTAIEKKSGNAILIKPNQIGTLTETLKVVKLAYENNWQAVVSHRSGETMDDFIADLAVGVGAWGLKAGAPAKPERMTKYERIFAINSKFQAPNSK